MLVQQKITLPNGTVLENRLVKAAMAEDLAAPNDPNEQHLKLYSQWSHGGWGMILTGNVQVSDVYKGAPADITTATPLADPSSWSKWASTIQANGTPAVVQLCHPGRQSPPGSGNRSFFTKNIAPSPVKMNMGDSLMARAVTALLFGTPREMTTGDIHQVIEAFAEGAKRAFEAGFQGVELHAAHGYLLAQFLSPLSNLRTDEFGGTAAKRAELLIRILRRIRDVTSPTFILGVKSNSVDASSGSLADVMEQIKLTVDAGIDFLEISGGTYENPTMMAEGAAPAERAATHVPSRRTLERESFFLSFAQQVRSEFPKLILMVTGGFRTRLGMEAALASGGADLVGIARPAAVVPDLPTSVIMNEKVTDEEANLRLRPVRLGGWKGWLVDHSPVKSAGAGAQSIYYVGQLHRMGAGEKSVDSRLAA
ncbi:NADH:flavin oxidoreductase/NADH oxidase-like protein [Amylocarpus encephaloides]|uniref:NADH:flavin oxidoreductase/NADH oxidase-like protein n=1 Tax=Amylocarpus encephaloides TaxID=45428 RepID=A0A9P7YQE9_9HELO|nr:NADH:flavin oxidoreductase/NADH oxidase-like protein [Amylocarpus encephaloides]